MATTNNGTTASETFGTTSPVTGSAPSGATDGQPLKGLKAVTLVAAAASTKTLSGAGTADCYLYDGSVALWFRYPPGDFTFVGIPSSQQAVGFETVDVLGARASRVKWVPTGVTHSGGSGGVTFYQLGHSEEMKDLY